MENLKLARLWSTRGLLALFDDEGVQRLQKSNPRPTDWRQEACQLGERSISGPSRFLPIGHMMTSLHCHRDQVLKGIITDRKDFYHQAYVTRQKAHLNLPFAYNIEEFYNTSAYDDLMRIREERRKSRKHREIVGDRYGKIHDAQSTSSSSLVFPAFKSLFWGSSLLCRRMALCWRAMDSSLPLQRYKASILFPEDLYGRVWSLMTTLQCLNKLLASGVKGCPALNTVLMLLLVPIRELCVGAPEQDVNGSLHFKIVGAEVDSRLKMRSRGQVLVGAPMDRRLSLAALSLKVCQFPVISRAVASRLAGAWTCVMMYRRCLTCIFKEIYGLGVVDGHSDDEVIPFRRSASTEMALAATLSFVASSNVDAFTTEEFMPPTLHFQKGLLFLQFSHQRW